ncbi:uncharacterized protein Z520_09655 [Fonsecaea multimorphosa CBS 102226]|uniref:Uncharacterized protein n=1 Tax=Fonsecaea multimorphosa CBS 102226 TaxID=1442371 RepID=A0A0D2JVR3_9EURO|nr:uncharacterized protein Z520_09655 [Fonsecaea multimorphosa CBS 102226]KIX94609.1 hypothetical protein Z520_09655 [Fonsecaea multimorphosa CBS 102226]OAL20317.1 hypothetical protein AYO22_09029 [Fonsecaea multimorphosa]
MAEKELDAATLGQNIATAFDQYTQPAHEIEEIRKQLFHIDAANELQSHQKLDDKLKAEYLEAVRANIAASRRHMEAAGTASPQALHKHSSPRPASAKTNLFSQHLELLRLRKQNARLTALTNEMNAIPSSPSLATTQLGSTTVESVAATPSSQHGRRQEDLPRSIMQSLQALEMAVVYARHEATQQKALLDLARSSIPEPGNAPDERHHAAMSVARKLLTIWLQESLDTCQEGLDVLHNQGVDDAPHPEEELEAQIGVQYEQYLEARRQLLSTAANLRTLLPEEKEPRGIRGTKSVEQSLKPQATDLVNLIERRLLPSMHQQRMSSSHLTLMDEQLHKESTNTINMLDRLSDESQLLQAFPLLARSGRFVHATSAFGDKEKQDAEADTKDEVSKRLGSWMFAAEAADVASSGQIEKHLKQGREAMDEVRRDLAAVQLLKEART